MAWTSTTRTTLRSPRFLPAFMIGTVRAAIAARRVPGFVTGRVRVTVRGELITLTVWDSPQDMRVFRDHSIHARLMPKLAAWASEGSYVGWPSESGAPPRWPDVHRRLREHGTFGEVARPSTAHVDRKLPTRSAPGLTLVIPAATRKNLRPRVAPGRRGSRRARA